MSCLTMPEDLYLFYKLLIKLYQGFKELRLFRPSGTNRVDDTLLLNFFQGMRHFKGN